MKPKQKRISEISKDAFLSFFDYERKRLDVLPMTPEEMNHLWERAKRYALHATETTICLDLSPRELRVIRQMGYKEKTKYIT